MDNRWPGRVSNSTINLLNHWIEKRSCGGYKPHFLPQPGLKHIFKQERDKNGNLIIRIEITEGVCFEHSTKKTGVTRLEEFGMGFLDLSEQEQMVILAGEDPFDELNSIEKWKKFLSDSKIHKQTYYDKLLELAMVHLQKITEQRGLSRKMENEKELRGWGPISAYLKCSVPTAMKLAKKSRAPITLLGATPYTTEEKLKEWKDKKVERTPIWKKSKIKNG